MVTKYLLMRAALQLRQIYSRFAQFLAGDTSGPRVMSGLAQHAAGITCLLLPDSMSASAYNINPNCTVKSTMLSIY